MGDLTPRELEVLRLMGEGLTYDEIAEQLVITRHTARTHATTVIGKLGAGDRTRAVLLAMRRGLIPLPAVEHDGGDTPPTPDLQTRVERLERWAATVAHAWSTP